MVVVRLLWWPGSCGDASGCVVVRLLLFQLRRVDTTCAVVFAIAVVTVLLLLHGYCCDGDVLL